MILLTVFLTGGLLFVMVEAGLRFKGTYADNLVFNTPPGPDGYAVFDEVLGHARLPGYRGTVRRTEYSYAVRSNSMGFRDEELPASKPSNEYRVMVLGDSIAAGYGVVEKERFTELIEDQFNSGEGDDAGPTLRMVNAAIGGHGTIQSRMVFEQFAEQVDPDAVLLVFSVNNDFENNKRVFNWQSGLEDYYLNQPSPGPVKE